MTCGIADESSREKSATARTASERIGAVLGACTTTMLVVFIAAAPHSIAVTQGAFIAGMIFWLLESAVMRRFRALRTPVDVPMAIFIVLTITSIVLSETPEHSIGRFRGVSLFLILYLFASNIRSRRFAWSLTLLLVLSSSANLVWTYYERFEGKGLKIAVMSEDSPLRKWGLQEGDTLLAADGRPVVSLEGFNSIFDQGDPSDKVSIQYFRREAIAEYAFRKRPVQKVGEGPERLGIQVAPGRDFRADGFFSHPVTYSEVMLLVGAVAAGWAIVAGRRYWKWAVAMSLVTATIAGAIVMTATRASVVSLALACIVMVLLKGARARIVVTAVLAGVLLVTAGGVFLLQGRHIGYVDLEDQSTTWRLTVWREGAGLVLKHPVFGIGPDAAKEKYKEWGLFEGGKLPPGHWHSTPLQIAVDRGIPALLAFVAIFGVFFVTIGRLARSKAREGTDWHEAAALLGIWGAVLGCLASSLVHFNIGDSEVVQVVWALMGVAFYLRGADGSASHDLQGLAK